MSSTKNKESKRDPDMANTKKGNSWHFGKKAHEGSDTRPDAQRGVHVRFGARRPSGDAYRFLACRRFPSGRLISMISGPHGLRHGVGPCHSEV